MAKLFHKIRRHKGRGNHQGRGGKKKRGPERPKGPVMDPILYLGDMDLEKYPPIDQDQRDKKPVEDIENPLNKR